MFFTVSDDPNPKPIPCPIELLQHFGFYSMPCVAKYLDKCLTWQNIEAADQVLANGTWFLMHKVGQREDLCLCAYEDIVSFQISSFFSFSSLKTTAKRIGRVLSCMQRYSEKPCMLSRQIIRVQSVVKQPPPPLSTNLLSV